MTGAILDASAVLAYVFGEAGGDAVLPHLRNAAMSALCYSEVLARAGQRSGSVPDAKVRIDALKITVVPFDARAAAMTASLFQATRPFGMSLADRACVALGMDRQVPVVTGDRRWADADLPLKLVLFR